MGDDDVICLSSDDEFTSEELSKKRQKLNVEPLLRTKLEPDNDKDFAVHGCKRKPQEELVSGSGSTKKPKLTTKKVIEEIIIDSPQKTADGEPELKVKTPTYLENREAVSVLRATPLKTSDSQPKPGNSSSIVPNPQNIANRSSGSKQSNNTPITLKSDDWKLATEKLSTESGKSQLNADGPNPSVAEVVHNFFSSAQNNPEIATDGDANGAAKTSSKSETSATPSEKIPHTPKSDRPKITARNNADDASNAKTSHRFDTSKTSRLEARSSSSAASRISAKSNDEDSSRESSKLSEIEIVHGIETPKHGSSSNMPANMSNVSGKNSSSSSDEQSTNVSSERPDTQNVRRIETPKADSSKIAAESSKSSGEQPIRKSSESSEVVIVDSITTSKAATSKIPVGNEVEKNSTKFKNIQPNCSSKSSEIKIIETQRNVSDDGTDKNAKSVDSQQAHSKSIVKEQKRKNTCGPMPRCIKIATAKGSNGSTSMPAASQPAPKSPEASSDVSQITNCEISNKETLHKTPSLFNGMVRQPKMCLSRKTSANKDSNSERPSSKCQTHEVAFTSTPMKSDGEVVAKRLTPHRLKSTNVLNHSKSSASAPVAANGKINKSSKFENSVSSRDSSKESDEKIANGLAEKKSEVHKIGKIKNGDTSKSSRSAPTAGGSKSSERTRKIVHEVEKESASVFEPKPGCSKTPDVVDTPEKPQLVVKAKMPAYTVNQDTFPMFLSLCLQTDRDDAMKKIVAKLKRYYDEMDPAYARSREFEELLNEKRDKIGEKGKKRVYLYTSHVMDEMRSRKKNRKPKETEETDKTDSSAVKANVEEVSAVNGPNNEVEDDEEEEDTSEARRRRHNIKKIEHAMRVCEKKIKKLEEAEVDSDDDGNSNYIKLDRYQVKMIELWTKMCEYTNEHADAGRPYLRPKHVRVTQIPSVDLAINSFINSRLGVNRKKSRKVTSFVDGIIFPDYVDILECIAKANDDQKLRLDKRAQEKIAQAAFTQLGDYLQTTRRNDYWDTFSLHLENNEDPATNDAELAEKLAQNEETNRARMTEVFEEFVRRQDEARSANRGENGADNEDDEEEEEVEDEEEEEEADKKSNCGVGSDLELLEDEDENDEIDKNNEDRVPSSQESTDEEEKDEKVEVEESTVREEDTRTNEKNNDAEEVIASPAESPQNSTDQEANETEVHIVEADNEDANKPEGEKRSLLRIRSFAKPPESWQASQEETATLEDCESRPDASKSKDIETIDVTEDDKISVVSKCPDKNERLQTLTIGGKTIVIKPFVKNANNAPLKTDNLPRVIVVSGPVTSCTKNRSSIIVQSPNKPPSNQSSIHANVVNSSNFAQTSKYLTVPRSQPRQSSIPQQVRIPQSGSLNLQPVAPNTSQQINRVPVKPAQVVMRYANGNAKRYVPLSNAQQIRICNPTISVSGQVPQTQTRTTQQQSKSSMVQNVQMPRGQLAQLRNGPYISATGVTRGPEFSQSNNSQQSSLGLPSGNGQSMRLGVPAHMQGLRSNNRHLITRPAGPQNPIQIPQANILRTSTQRDGKISNSCELSIVVPGDNAPGQSTPPVLKLRMNDNISTTSATVQQQRSQQRVGRPGDQNWTPGSREASLKK